MNRSFKKIWKETLIVALCFILLGCFMLMQPDKTIEFFSYIIGSFILVLAVFAFYRHYRLQKMLTFELFYGIICTVGAILIFLNQTIVETLIPIVLGIVMIANAFFKLQYIFDLKKTGVKNWYVSLILALVKIALGVCMIVNPFADSISLTQFIGIVVLVFAISDVVDLVMIKYYLNEDLRTDDGSVSASREVIDVEDLKEIEDK